MKCLNCGSENLTLEEIATCTFTSNILKNGKVSKKNPLMIDKCGDSGYVRCDDCSTQFEFEFALGQKNGMKIAEIYLKDE